MQIGLSDERFYRAGARKRALQNYNRECTIKRGTGPIISNAINYEHSVRLNIWLCHIWTFWLVPPGSGTRCGVCRLLETTLAREMGPFRFKDSPMRFAQLTFAPGLPTIYIKRFCEILGCRHRRRCHMRTLRGYPLLQTTSVHGASRL